MSDPSLHHSITPSLLPLSWTIAGSDSGGGAGIQADLKTFQSLGVHGCSAITAITAQNTRGVQRVEHVAPGMIQAQLFALAEDLPPASIKIGMLGGTAAVQAVADFLDTVKTYVVCDPVMMATRGGALLDDAAYNTFRDEILPRVDLLTPNVPEAERLLSRRIDSPAEAEQAARDLLKLGVKAVLFKGGHMGSPMSCDYWTHGTESAWLNSPRLATEHSHGGGCTLSAAIAAGRARGLDELSAITLAKTYTNQGLRGGGGIGGGRGPVSHDGWPTNPDDLPWITTTAAASPDRLRFEAEGPLPLGVYPIVDRADWLERLLPAGLKLVQIRVKDLEGAALEAEIRRAVDLSRRFGARLYINDHWRLALRFGAYGVHIGQDDLPGTDLVALQKAGLRLGLSTHNFAELARAMQIIPSYVAIGTLFHSPSKTFSHNPLGLDPFRLMKPLAGVPVVAIGGISLALAGEVEAAGADGLAVISDVLAASDPAQRVREWLSRSPKNGPSST